VADAPPQAGPPVAATASGGERSDRRKMIRSREDVKQARSETREDSKHERLR
jgi:hypothetical protein